MYQKCQWRCFRHLSGRSFGTLLLSIRCISRPIRRRSSLGRRPRAHISQGCARCKESGPDRLGHSPASGPVAPGRTRVGARLPSCGAAVDAPPPPAHGSFKRRAPRALGGGEGRCVFSGAQLNTSPYLSPLRDCVALMAPLLPHSVVKWSSVVFPRTAAGSLFAPWRCRAALGH